MFVAFPAFHPSVLTPEMNMFPASLLVNLALLSLLPAIVFAQQSTPSPSSAPLLNGFVDQIRGENIAYRSFHPNARAALLTRCTDGKLFIGWKTAEIPHDFTSDFATFAWMAAHSSGTSAADATFRLSINGTEWFKFTTIKGRPVRQWALNGKDGARLSFEAKMEDSGHDLYGFMFLRVPLRHFPKGQPLSISVVGDSVGRRDWYMTFKYPLRDSMAIQAQPAVVRSLSGKKQLVDVLVEYSQLAGNVELSVPGQRPVKAELKLGLNAVPLSVDAVTEPSEIEVTVAVSGQPVKKEKVAIQPVTYREFWLIPHSHNDIGYSDLQADVEKKQLKNLRDAMQLCRKTGSYPKEARFKWNTEILWAVRPFLATCTGKERDEFMKLVKNGSIGLNGLFTHELTGLCRPEELLRLTDYARELEKTYGVQIKDAMITDIPGYVWATVPALVQGGIKYFSSGPNYVPSLPDQGDRVGRFNRAWADKPFYWVSPSGEDTLLLWVAGKGYSWFHDWISGKAGPTTAAHVYSYLRELEEKKYPYDMVQLRYTVIADNGPTDPNLPDFVRSWNEKYESPKLIMATTTQMFEEFERRWAKDLPSYAGDITPYWEDGALSTLRELGIVRRASERLVQAEAVACMSVGKSPEPGVLDDAWRNVLLFDEHTWGAHNSVSEPESPFAISQWQVKQRFALDAGEQSDRLLSAALSPVVGGSAVDVMNTASWSRTALVVLPPEERRAGDSVVDALGTPIPSQRLSTGGLAFIARDVPPLGARRYFVKAGPSAPTGNVTVSETGLSNGLVSLVLDPETGALRSLKMSETTELVDISALRGLNQYCYVPGRNPSAVTTNSVKQVEIKEQGPIVGTVRIVSQAPGCKALIQEVTLIDGIMKVEILNIVDKSIVREKESVHFAFPLNVPGGAFHLDGGWGIVRPMHDQLPGSCMDYLSTGRWVDVSNSEVGVTWTTIESPLMEIGQITDETLAAHGYRVWRDSIGGGTLFYSYAMNNYWHTNYAPFQEGPAQLSYALFPHGKFDPVEAYRRGIEQSQPLLVRQSTDRDPIPGSLFSLSSANVVTTSIKPSRDGKAVMVRLYNASRKLEECAISWGALNPKSVFVSSPDESKGARAEETFSLPSFGILTLRCER